MPNYRPYLQHTQSIVNFSSGSTTVSNTKGLSKRFFIKVPTLPSSHTPFIFSYLCIDYSP